MRYMWICNRHLSPSYVLDEIHQRGEPVVRRQMRTTLRSCWVFITNRDTYEWAKEASLLDAGVGPWTITACNKQHVTDWTDELSHKWLGCLTNVDLIEAATWINADYSNWYLREPNTDTNWIPVMRNPNKMIPTGEKCRVCDGTGVLPQHKPLDRPWPLHADA